jgi:eukaryotic-like serine/threonine-protein kinase
MAAGHNRCANCGEALPTNASDGLCARCRAARTTACDPGLDQPPDLAPTDPEVTTPHPSATVADETRAARLDGGPATFDANKETATLLGGRPTSPALPRGATVRYFGDYELHNELGRGGMGVVYQARQVSLNRPVALKMLKAGVLADEGELRRFQNEAEAVASLDHPGIVPVYEVGEHHGQRYFSMKLVEGGNLAEHLASFKDKLKAAATLLVEIAGAVQHAHVRGVLHRDLKPANILIDAEGHPHVTDFGVAKRVDTDAGLTHTGLVLGTPAFMSPEAASGRRGAFTTSADVYGLGAILYALLTGRAPFGGESVIQTLEAVRTRPAPPPKKYNGDVPPDLETICLKCLEKEPARRYHSALDLAADLERWVEGRPITARHVGGVARAVMWYKRKPLVAALATSLVIAVFLGSLGILVNWLEVRRANARYRSEWEASRQLNEFLVTDILGQSSPFGGARPDIPVSALLDRSAQSAGSRFATRPKIEASIRQVLGFGYLSLGMLPKAEAELLRGAKLRQALPEGDELDRLSSEYLLARLRLDQGKYDAAEVHAVKAHEGRLRRLGASDETTIEAAEVLAAVLRAKGKSREAQKLLEKAAADARENLGELHRLTLQTRTDLAVLAYDQGRFVEALAGFKEVADAETRVFGADYSLTLIVRSMVGATLMNLGDDAKAEQVLEAAHGPARAVLGPAHPETLRISGNLALARSHLKKFVAATQGIGETLQSQRNAALGNDAAAYTAEVNRAVILIEQSKLEDADVVLRDLIPRMRTHLAADDPLLGVGLTCRAAALWDLDRTAEAEPLNAEAITIFRKRMPDDHPQVVNTEGNHAALLLANGKVVEAEKLAARVVELRSRPGWVGNPARLGSSKSVLGGALAAQKKFAEAEPLLLNGFRLIDGDPKAVKRRRDDAVERLIQLYESLGKSDEADKWRKSRAPQPGS